MCAEVLMWVWMDELTARIDDGQGREFPLVAFYIEDDTDVEALVREVLGNVEPEPLMERAS